MNSLNLLLASNSPRRRQFLEWLGCPYRVQTVDIDETKHEGENAEQYVMRVARLKAQAAHSLVRPGETLLCADTIVADGDALLGKPGSPQEAKDILLQLRGRNHRVYSAIVLYASDTDTWLTDICCSVVPMRNYADDEIDAYIDSGDPMDKAGAYAIQHSGFHPVENFQDCYASVMGLPLCHLSRSLQKLGFRMKADIPYTCFQKMDYDCNTYPKFIN